ncbi:HemK2/MTQ2 family protein methyltransferase [Salinirubellus sp. GCM10025818]|uniref:HemK2/MTQ2 family protein methyltransferase n=1 Tax=Salinirubellus TaxID=2162630 RepID=UPI0030CF5C99
MTDLAERRGVETEVYGAAEDSHLLARAAVMRAERDDLVLDVGTGSGYVAATVAETTGARVIGSDLNPHACRRAQEVGIEAVRADLVTPFRDSSFDLVTFNPPYLPTPEEDGRDDWMERALSGGESGREVIEPFLDTVRRVLVPDGRVLLLVSSLTGIDAVRDRARNNGLTTRVVEEESFPFERLVVLSLRPTSG